MEIQEKIAKRIKDIRTSKNLTQEALAFRSDVDRTFMNYVENCKRNITLKSLEKIVVQGLDTSLQEFFNDKLFNGKKK
jgi:transcriptional regulator with XRE-family HTH domain